MRRTLVPLLRSAPYTCSVIATVSPVPLVQAVPAVTEAVVWSLIGPGDESVEGDGHVENGCGHGVSFLVCGLARISLPQRGDSFLGRAALAVASGSPLVGEREVVTVSLVVLVQLPDAGESRAVVAELCAAALSEPRGCRVPASAPCRRTRSRRPDGRRASRSTASRGRSRPPSRRSRRASPESRGGR